MVSETPVSTCNAVARPGKRTKLAVTAALAALLFGLAVAPRAEAQANAANYTFSTTTTGSLSNMTGSTQLLAANIDDTASPVTLLGFEFFFMGARQDRFSINENGVLRFGAAAQAGSPYKPLAQAALPIVTAYGADQRTHAGDGKVHFRVLGSAPNRVAVIQWLNNQANFNTGGTADLTYEVRLAETTGCIEYAYGSMTMSVAGAGDVNSQNPNIGFSSNNAAGTVGSVTAAQSGTPAPSYNGASATPVANLYTAGAITVLTSAADGSRRTFLFCPPIAPAPAGGPLTFTGVTPTGMTLNWTDSANEVGYAIYASTDGGVNYTFMGAAAQNAVSFNATGLSPSTTYDWRVVATSEGAVAAPLSATQGTPAPTPKTSTGTGLWSAPATWSPAGVPASGDAVTIAAGHTVTIDTAATAFSVTVASGGILQFEQTTARTLTVSSNVNIQAGGTFQSNTAGTVTTHNLSIPGNLVNDGTLDFSTNADTAGAIITFTGTTNTSFSGTGATTDIRQITVNKGTTPTAIMELMPSNFTVRGVTTDTVVGGWLVMTNGTIKISGNFTGTSRVFATAAYTIPISFGFWLNNPNYTVAAQAGNAVNNGVWRVTQGTFNQGTLVTHSFRGGTGAVFTIEGGTINCAGQFSPQNAVTYNQSNGTLNVGTVGNSQSNFGTFELFSGSATFNMTGGTINIVQASTGATQIDYQNLATVVAAAGTLRVGTGATVTKFTFNIRGNMPNLIIDNTTNNKSATATTVAPNTTNLFGTTLINTGTTLTINGQTCLVIGPTFTNNGTLTGTAASTRFYFLGILGPTTYTGTGVVTAPLTAFEVDNVNGVTISPSTTNQITTARFNNFSGGLTGSGKLTIGNGGATTAVTQLGVTGATQPVTGFDVPPVYNPGTGGVILLYAPELTGRTTGNEMPPSRTLTTLSITNTNNITIAGGDVTVNGVGAGALALGASRVITGANTLFFNSTVGTVTRSTGYVDGNFKRTYAAAGSITYDVGTANGYTPVIFNATAGTFPTDVTVAAVQSAAPGIQPLSKVINRYWRLTATGVTADVTVSYLDPADIPGTVTEANLHFLRHGAANPADYSDQGGTVNTGANTATVTGVTTFSDWTLGEAEANVAITKTDGVTTAVAGGTVTYTISASNGGTVGNPAATVADTFPASLTCNWTCVGAGGGTCTASGSGNINDSANVPSGGTATYTAICGVSPTATGSIVNTATISNGAVPDPDNANNSATDTDTVGISADLSITKTDGVTTVNAGGSVTYTITASNAGPSAVTGATVADTFPASLTCTWTCVGAGGGTCTASGSGNINNSVNLPAGGSVTYTATCTVSAAATGTLSNTATVAAPAGATDPNPGNNSATDTDTITIQTDVAITKTDGATTAVAGGSVTYTITASNAGPSNATGATVADTFPASLTCTWTCVGAGGGTCTASGSGNINNSVNLPAGGSVTYTATCAVSAAATGSLSNTATVAAPAGATDPNPGNNSATDTDTISIQPDVAITKTDGVTTAPAGGSVTYTITASNAGPSNATGSTVADTFPAALTCTWTCVGAGGGTCTASGSGNIGDTVNLPTGGSVTYTATCAVSAAATGSLCNTATVAAPAGANDPAPANNSATDCDTVGVQADLSITKTDGATTATAGGSVTYTIVASNAGPSAATGATVADTFPASLTCTWTCVGTAGGVSGSTCTASGSGNINDTVNLPVGTSVTYTATCTVSATACGTLSNTATIAPPTGVADSNPANNSATDTDTIPAQADLSITKTDGTTTVTAGGSVTYTIVASSTGPCDVTGATVTDNFPNQLTGCTWTCSGTGTCTASGTGNINDTVNLPAGSSVTYTATCNVSATATGTLSNTATITPPAGVTDPTPTNGSSTDADIIQPGGPPPSEIPTLSSIGLMLLAVVLAGLALLVMRRRQKA